MTFQHQHKQNIVVFDLDGTITRYDTYVRFLIFVIFRHPIKTLRLPALAIDILRHKLGKRNNTWLKEQFLNAILAGMSRDTINSLTTSFSDHVMRSGIYSDAIACINKHRTEGCEIILLSASLDIYVEPLARMLGFKHVICTRTCWDNDILGNTLDGGNCYGNAKIERLQTWLTSHENDTPDDNHNEELNHYVLEAYGDHESDFPLLKLATRGLVVNPGKILKQKAENNNLETITWK